MAEQQLIDYIKKARVAGQSDGQSRVLLGKNGWTDIEINDALASIDQPLSSAQPQPQIQPRVQPQAAAMPKMEVQTQAQTQPKPMEKPQPQMPAQMPPPQMQPQMAQTNMPRSRRGSHLILKLIMVLIILGVLGGVGYFVAGQYLNISIPFSLFGWSPFGPSPEKVISNMFANMKNVKTSHMVINASAAATDSKKAPQGGISVKIVAENDGTNVNNQKADATVSVNVTAAGTAASAASVDANLVFIGNAFYFKINNTNLPIPSNISNFDISQLIGTFFEVDQASVTALSQVPVVQAEASNIPPVTDLALVSKIQNLIASENLLSATKQLTSEVISGQDTYHYLVTISSTKLKDLAGKIIALQAQTSSTGTSTGSSPLVTNMAQAFVNTAVDALGDINVEMWIGKTDYLLYRASVDKTVDLSKLIPGMDVLVDAKFDETSSNFNKSLSILAPAGAKKIEDVVLPMFKTQQVQADIAQIGTIAATSFQFDNNLSAFCNHGLLNGFYKMANGSAIGATLISINSDIIRQGAKRPVCYSDAQDLCVSTQLTDGTYSCVDKNSTVGKTQCTSAKTVCK